MTYFKVILSILICFIVIFLLIGFITTLLVQKSDTQKQFLSGHQPNPLPNGMYNGSTDLYHGQWSGKKFNDITMTGANEFTILEETTDQYPFRMYYAEGLKDKDLSVLRLDYDIVGNPLWARGVVDELVQVDRSGNKYIGKINYELPFNIVFTIGFFTLEK